MRFAAVLLVLVLVLVLVLASPLASAASPEDAYIAAIAKKSGDKQDAEDRRLSKELEAQLRRLIAPPRLAGFPGLGKMSPDTLIQNEVDSGALDAISFLAKDQADVALVTTEGLLQRWLIGHKNWWDKPANAPTEPEAAFRSEAFYTQALSNDAAMSIFATLPIEKPTSAKVAVAFLGEESQDLAVDPPDTIVVAVVNKGKVFIAAVKAATKLSQIPACDTIWKDFTAKSDAALAKYNQSGLKDEKSFDESRKLRSDGEGAVHKCWSEHAKTLPEFAALAKQAQALTDLFAAQ